jgi:hypothetical protein
MSTSSPWGTELPSPYCGLLHPPLRPAECPFRTGSDAEACQRAEAVAAAATEKRQARQNSARIRSW